MWLLNAETIRLEYFIDDRQLTGQYAILSHSWGVDEVTFDEIHSPECRTKAGFKKIRLACRQAQKDRLKYCWVDTCCIDKRSSAELSESINSMYRWYAHAKICYAYLADVDPLRLGNFHDFLSPSRWFTRGWTLQELIAPREVRFYDSNWSYLGSKSELLDELSGITMIGKDVLQNRDRIKQASVAQRMSWASNRTTTRLEDEAYCLLGIFGVNMPLLYGEGERAFLRLQEEIIRSRSWPDHSILAHNSIESELLAKSPKDFQHATSMSAWPPARRQVFELSSTELRLRGPIMKGPHSMFAERHDILVLLNCSDSSDSDLRYSLPLRPQNPLDQFDEHVDYDESTFHRGGLPISIPKTETAGSSTVLVNIARTALSGFVDLGNKVQMVSQLSSYHPFPRLAMSPGIALDSPGAICAATLARHTPTRTLTLQVANHQEPTFYEDVRFWARCLRLYLHQALPGPYDIIMILKTWARSTKPSARPALSIQLLPPDAELPLTNSAEDSTSLSHDLDTWIAARSTRHSLTLSRDLETWIAAKSTRNFWEPGSLTLQRDGWDVLRFDIAYITLHGEMMWRITITEMPPTFMVE